MDMRSVCLIDGFVFLRNLSKRLDPAGKGVNFVIPSGVAGRRVSIDLSHIPMLDAVRYICMLANVECVLQGGMVIIRPRSAKKGAE